MKGNSASGKSWVVKKVLRLFPAEAYFARSAMSSKALVYSAESYEHRMIVLYEVTGMRENADDDMTAYLIRTLLSEGRLDYEVTVKDRQTGNPTTEHIIKEGPTDLVFTTTQTTVHAENETRLLSLNTNDSTEQTARVKMRWTTRPRRCRPVRVGTTSGGWPPTPPSTGWSSRSRPRATGPAVGGAVAPGLHRAAGVDQHARDDAPAQPETRRAGPDHRLRRHDYGAVRDLVAGGHQRGRREHRAGTVHETVAAVVDLAPSAAGQRAIHHPGRAKLGIDKSNAGRRLKVAADGGYIENRSPRGFATAGSRASRCLRRGRCCPLLRTCCVRVLRFGQASDQDCCGVAVKKEGKKKGVVDPDAAGRTPPAQDALQRKNHRNRPFTNASRASSPGG